MSDAIQTKGAEPSAVWWTELNTQNSMRGHNKENFVCCWRRIDSIVRVTPRREVVHPFCPEHDWHENWMFFLRWNALRCLFLTPVSHTYVVNESYEHPDRDRLGFSFSADSSGMYLIILIQLNIERKTWKTLHTHPDRPHLPSHSDVGNTNSLTRKSHQGIARHTRIQMHWLMDACSAPSAPKGESSSQKEKLRGSFSWNHKILGCYFSEFFPNHSPVSSTFWTCIARQPWM